MNLGVFYDSCNYISDNYNLLSKLSIYTFELLTQRNHSKHKFQTAVSKVDIEVVELLIDYEDKVDDEIIIIMNRISNFHKQLPKNQDARATIDNYIRENRLEELVTLLVKKKPQDLVNFVVVRSICLYGFYECVKILMENGFVFHIKSCYIINSCKSGNERLIKLMFENLAAHNKKPDLKFLSYNIYSIKLGLQHGITEDINMALAVTIFRNDIESSRLLIENGGRLHGRNLLCVRETKQAIDFLTRNNLLHLIV